MTTEGERAPWWHPAGTIGRTQYLFIGLILFLLKFNIDRIIAVFYGSSWLLYQYWLPHPVRGSIVDAKNRGLLLALLVAALPFIYIGVVLTLKRLRSAGLPPWLVAIFFIPFVNLIFFLVLSLVPPNEGLPSAPRTPRPSWLPQSNGGAMAAGVLGFELLAVSGAFFSAKGITNYGVSLFIGTPFAAGLVSALLLNAHRDQGAMKTQAVAASSLLISAGLMMGFLIEGLVCVAMAVPFALPLTMLGAVIGRGIARASWPSATAPAIAGMVFLIVPSFSAVEKLFAPAPEKFQVRSEVVVNAPPELVWRHVVSFSELPPPTEAIFKTGIAYPIRAEIANRGVGAKRRCVFSTGAFVEPITAWEEPRRLAFGVEEQPPVMRELSWRRDFVPAHVTNRYLRSTAGEFLLEPLPGGRTRLIGTTWYELQFWPAAYWRLWSDAIIHRIHLRVLAHVKTLSEQ